MSSVFITGATGYIGGEVLYRLLTKGGFKVTALVRTQEKADLLEQRTNGAVKTVIGCLDDLDVIEKEVQAADIVINTANVDHVPSAQVMANALEKKTQKTIFIHTSGTSVVGDKLDPSKGPSLTVYSDVSSIDDINSLDDSQPHRPVDRIVLDVENKNPLVKTVVVSPSTIFGKSNGYDNVFSKQIPYLAELSKQHGRVFTVYLGDYIWSRVHISDLGDLYSLLLEKLMEGAPIATGTKGYYFGAYPDSSPITSSPAVTEFRWKDVAVEVGKILKERGDIETADVEEQLPDEIVRFSGDEFGPYYWGSNSRTRGDNATRHGWKPRYTDASIFWNSIKDDVAHACE